MFQVNGKLRGKIELGNDEAKDKARVMAAAKALPGYASHVGDKSIRKEIFVPAKLLNLVV